MREKSVVPNGTTIHARGGVKYKMWVTKWVKRLNKFTTGSLLAHLQQTSTLNLCSTKTSIMEPCHVDTRVKHMCRVCF